MADFGQPITRVSSAVASSGAVRGVDIRAAAWSGAVQRGHSRTVASATERQARKPRRQNPATAGTVRRFCESVGHQSRAAAAVGVFNDGDEVWPDTAYCAECALALAEGGEFTVTEVLDVLSLGTRACPNCHGTGRLNRQTGDPVSGQESTSRLVGAVLGSFEEVDDTSPGEMTGLFYAEAYWHLRSVVEDLVQGVGPFGTP